MYRTWVSHVARLAQAVRALDPLARQMNLPPAESFDWHGNLFQKLLPQLEQEPFLIVAVTGGTNTGKSSIFNHLAGSPTSRTHPNATQTKHPVCSVPRGFLKSHDLAAVFPDFEVRPWTSENDALQEGPDNLLFVREDPAGTQPQRLLLLDTPDIDGTLRTNWRRAELVRHAADVLVAILTQQKYNDAAVREFFEAAAAVDKTVLVVFNMVHWPRQRDVIDGWLATFSHSTGVDPEHVYAAPFDHDAAEHNRLPFHALSPGATNPRDDLAELHFDEIKIRSLRGSLLGVLDEQHGLPAYLAAIERRSMDYRNALNLLQQNLRLSIADLPQLPRHLVWEEITQWFDRRRTRPDLFISQVYRFVESKVRRLLGSNVNDDVEQFRTREAEVLRRALADGLDELKMLRDAGNDVLRKELCLSEALKDPRSAFQELKARHDSLPLISEEYRQFIRSQLDAFERDNPRLVKFVTWTLISTTVMRPVVTIALIPFGAHALDAAVAHVGAPFMVEFVGGVIVGEGVAASARGPIQGLATNLFKEFYVERAKLLTQLIQELVLNSVVVRIAEGADVPQSEPFTTAERMIETLAAVQGPMSHVQS